MDVDSLLAYTTRAIQDHTLDHRPFATLTFAQSIDGSIASPSGTKPNCPAQLPRCSDTIESPRVDENDTFVEESS